MKGDDVKVDDNGRGKTKSVLIVEDDYFQAHILEKMVIHCGYSVAGKSDTGEYAIDLAIKSSPDIILMDISLRGEMDGIDTVHEIQKTLTPVVIYLTGNSDDYHISRAKETGYLRYLNKPINLPILRGVFNLIDESS